MAAHIDFSQRGDVRIHVEPPQSCPRVIGSARTHGYTRIELPLVFLPFFWLAQPKHNILLVAEVKSTTPVVQDDDLVSILTSFWISSYKKTKLLRAGSGCNPDQ